jgi:hypothetical protein
MEEAREWATPPHSRRSAAGSSHQQSDHCCDRIINNNNNDKSLQYSAVCIDALSTQLKTHFASQTVV